MASSPSTAICRICREKVDSSDADGLNPILSPCNCIGSSGNVHFDCLAEWIRTSTRDTCSICKSKYTGITIELTRPNVFEFLAHHSIVGGSNFGLFLGTLAFTTGLCVSRSAVGRITGYIGGWMMFDYLLGEYSDRQPKIAVRLQPQ